MDTNTVVKPGYQAMLDEAKERRIEALRLHTTEGKSLKEIGEIFGVSRERARQLVAKAMKENQPAT